MVGMTTEGEDTEMLKYVAYNCLSSPRRIVGVPHDCPAFDTRCPSNKTLWVLSAFIQSHAEDHIFIGSFRVLTHYKDSLPPFHPSQTPSPFTSTDTPSNCLPPSLLRNTQWLTFNNAFSYSSSFAASHCVCECVYCLLIVCGAYGLVTSQAKGHWVKEFISFCESFWLPSSLT